MPAYLPNPLILDEMDPQDFHLGDLTADHVSIKVSTSSPVPIGHSANGLTVGPVPASAITGPLPASLLTPSNATKFIFDAVSKTLTLAIDGQADQTVNLAALDDEGTKIVVNGQNLELQNGAGTVLSSTPIGQIDAQQLTGVAGATGYKLNLSNGGSVTIACNDIGQMYATGTAAATTELLSKDCKAVPVSSLPIAPSQVMAGPLPAGVTIDKASLPPLDCAMISAAFTTPAAPGTVADTLLATGCKKVNIAQPLSAFGQPLNFLAIAK